MHTCRGFTERDQEVFLPFLILCVFHVLIAQAAARTWTGFELKSLKMGSFTTSRTQAVLQKAMGKGIPVACAYDLRTNSKENTERQLGLDSCCAP